MMAMARQHRRKPTSTQHSFLDLAGADARLFQRAYGHRWSTSQTQCTQIRFGLVLPVGTQSVTCCCLAPGR